MNLPIELTADSIDERKIYFFHDVVPDGSDIYPRHRYICFKKHCQVVCLVECTTQEATIDKYIMQRSLPTSTKVHLSPNETLNLPKDTFINCNTCYNCEVKDLAKLLSEGTVDFCGEIEGADYASIISGLKVSPVIKPAIKALL